jgi:hypothetical protein
MVIFNSKSREKQVNSFSLKKRKKNQKGDDSPVEKMGWEIFEGWLVEHRAGILETLDCESCEKENLPQDFEQRTPSPSKIHYPSLSPSSKPLDFHWRFLKRTLKAPFYLFNFCEIVNRLNLAKKGYFSNQSLVYGSFLFNFTNSLFFRP